MTPFVANFISKCPPIMGRVLEIGAFNVNGSARDSIRHEEWLGVDMRMGPGVDMCVDATDLSRFADESYDAVVCCETLEHVREWSRVVKEMWRVLKMDGVAVITTPAPGFAFHEYPGDFWRFTKNMWAMMFFGQDVIAFDEWRGGAPASGIIVRKKVNTLYVDHVTPRFAVMPDGAPSHVMIATPFYEMKGYSPYIRSLLTSVGLLEKAGIQVEYEDINGDSYVERAKNTLLARFLRSKCTDLVMIDSDMGWEPMGIVRLLMHQNVELVGTAYPRKNSDRSSTSWAVSIHTNADDTPVVDAKTGLISADWVPGGFTRYRRSCVQRMWDAYERDLTYVDPGADAQNLSGRYVGLFSCEIVNNLRVGEDVMFMKRWREIGGQVWCEPRITMSHFGSDGWHGNFDTWMRSRPRPMELIPEGNVVALTAAE